VVHEMVPKEEKKNIFYSEGLAGELLNREHTSLENFPGSFAKELAKSHEIL
jgi:hypothetical protein